MLRRPLYKTPIRRSRGRVHRAAPRRGVHGRALPGQSDWIGTAAMQPLPLLVSHPETPLSIRSISADLQLSPQETRLAIKLFKQGLPPLVNRSCLPYLFGLSDRLIAAMEKWPVRYYRVYTIEKAKAGNRRIEAPRRFLKLIQTWINAHICNHLSFPSCVKGFVKGQSIFTNALVHVRGRNLMVVDIRDFFPSIPLERVVKAFATFRFPPDVCRQLARLCCLQNRLPQGAPTSPALANCVFRGADLALRELAKTWGCRYTRYADDLAFSGRRIFSLEDMGRVQGIVQESGFSINSSKSRTIGQGGRQMVAGLVVNKKPQPPRLKRRRWRALFHQASLHPEQYIDQAARLSGIASFIRQYSPQTVCYP